MYISTRKVIKTATLAFLMAGSLLTTKVLAQQKTVDNSILSIERNSADNTPKFISFTPSAGWKAGQEQAIFRKYLNVDGTNTTFEPVTSSISKNNITSERYAQYYKGIKIEYGSALLSIKNGVVQFMTANYYNPAQDLSATPGISEATAFSKALDFVHAEKYMWQDATSEKFIKKKYHNNDTSFLPHGNLEWVEDYTTGNGDRQLHLAYSFDVYAQKPLSRQLIFVDAQTGKILHSNSIIKHTAATVRTLYSQTVPIKTALVAPATYWLFDSTRGHGVYTVDAHDSDNYYNLDFVSTTNIWPPTSNDTAALDAQWGAEMVYDYWLTEQGRHSWDNTDSMLVQFVHWGSGTPGVGLDNAFWDGAEMCYGDGTGCAGGGFTYLTSLDVTAHEIGHGVCQSLVGPTGLAYVGESGAMNEGFSDCWGATIENWANPHETDAVAKQPWKIGEEIGCGNPLRSMDNPELQGQPSVYHQIPYWSDSVAGCTTSPSGDNCGVHQNSGVLNHWYYLITMGGVGVNAIGTSYNVNALGWTEAQQILFATESSLSPTSHFADCRTISIAATTGLFGACSPEVQSVTNAWNAVGVGAAFVPCTPQIGFIITSLDTTEYAATTTCPASKVINIGVQPTGPTITGGNPIVNVVVGSGTAVSGVDYTLTSSSMIFTAGSSTPHYATLTLFDNGAVNDSKTLVLGLTISAAGTGTTISPTADSMRITITNDDNAPLPGGPEYHTLTYDVVADSVTSNLTSSFYAASKRSRTQFLLLASELTAAGVRPNVPITQIGFKVLIKNTTIPFTNYTVEMANTTQSDMSTAFVTGLTVVYTGNYTTYVGIDTIAFSTPFTWDGTSNLAVQVCFGANSATGTSDQVVGVQHANTMLDRATSNTGTGDGCALTFNSSNTNSARPWVRFKQVVPPTPVETVLASTHTWNVKSGTEVYFYNTTDTNVIAGLKNPTNDLGCVAATVTGSGNGMTPSVFSTLNRSRKEVTIVPTINGATTSYDATIYLTTTELAGTAPSSLYLLKTDAATDAGVNASNTVIVTPTLISGTNYTGFQGHFSGFSRYFLVDGPTLCTAPTSTITAGGPTTFCLGGSVTLNANTGTGLTYQWQLGGSPIAGATNSTYSASNGGAYTVVITQTGCSGTSAATNVTVDSAYAAPISASSGTTVCTGQTISLSDITSSGVWQSSDNTVATVSTSGVVTGVGTVGGSVTISYTVTNLCGPATATIPVTVNVSPAVSSISGTSTFCAGVTNLFTDATGTGTWGTSDNTVASVDASGNVTGVGAGTAVINYSVTNTASCTTTASTGVTILPQPPASITATGSTTFCTGASVLLNANTGTGLTYQWQVDGADVAGATNSGYTATTSGAVTVIVTGINSCSTTSSALTTTESGTFVVVPAVAITATPGILVCIGSGPVSFNATPTNGGTTPTYQWSVNGTTVAAGAGYTYIPADGDVVSCVMTSNAACATPDTASNSVSMTVSAPVLPSVSISTASGDTACTGVPTTFVAVPVFGGTPPSYVWTKNGVNVATGATYTYVPATGDVIVCTMTSSFPCRSQDTAVSSAVTMVVEAPTANTITVTASSTSIVTGETVTFTANAPHAGASPVYVWFVNGVIVPGATSDTYTTDTLVNGQIVTCEVTSSEPCAAPHTNMSTGITVLVTNGVQNVNNLNSFMLIPNPNKGTFVIKGNVGAADNLTVKITDVLGQVVYTQTIQIHNGVVNQQVILGSSLANGVYMINITSSAGTAVYHMVLDK